MTWTKTGSEFPDDAFNVELSDAAYRTDHEAITYLFKLERTDCYIRTDEVRRFAGSPHVEMAVTELVNLGWWRVQGQGYEVMHHGDVIRSGITAQAKKRDRNKRNQQAWRERQVSDDKSDDKSDDVSAYADRQTDKQALTASQQDAEPWPSLRGRGNLMAYTPEQVAEFKRIHDFDHPESELNRLEIVYAASLAEHRGDLGCPHCDVNLRPLPMAGVSWGIEHVHEPHCAVVLEEEHG